MISNELQDFATGLVNETLERHMFKTRNQEGGKFRQLFDRTLIIKPKTEFCFDNYRGLERDGIVPGFRQKLLPEAKLTQKETERHLSSVILHQKTNLDLYKDLYM